MDWSSATTKKHIKEAEAVGLRLIGQGRNKAYRKYRCNNCGNEWEIELKRVRINEFKCHNCFEEKLVEEAKAKGLELLGRGKKRYYRVYRFNNCGHQTEKRPDSVRTYKSYTCNTCLNEKLEKEANAADLKLLGAGRNHNTRKYRFNSCGHKQEIDRSSVKRNRFECNTCLNEKLEKEANAADLKLLGSIVGKHRHFRKYRFNECGHEQPIRIHNVRRMAFVCNTCEETSRDLPSKVYILKIQSDSFIWLKLGYAKQISFRIKQYGLPEDAKVRRLKVIDFDTGREAHEFESKLHTKYKREKLPIKKMKEFHKDGYNECYPLEMLDTLMGELDPS